VTNDQCVLMTSTTPMPVLAAVVLTDLDRSSGVQGATGHLGWRQWEPNTSVSHARGVGPQQGSAKSFWCCCSQSAKRAGISGQ
jgi:hypothetical protein